jgi:hypothetical protein
MLLFILSEYLSITEKTYEHVLASNRGNFLLVKVWHLWCSRSKEFAPIWEEFTRHDLEIPNAKFGDIECSENPTLCARLIGTSYPQVLWFDPEYNVTKRFEAQRTIPNLVQFARDMRAWPFVVGKDFDYAQSRASPWNPVPFITLPESSWDDTLKLLKNVFCKLGKLAVVSWDDAKELRVLTDRNASIFQGNWIERELFEWLRRSTLSRCELLTPDLLPLLKENGAPFVHFFVDPKKRLDEFVLFVHSLPDYQYTYAPYEPDSALAAVFDAKNRKAPVALWYDPKTSARLLYDGAFTASAISAWISRVDAAPPAGARAGPAVAALAALACAAVCVARFRRVKKSAYLAFP